MKLSAITESGFGKCEALGEYAIAEQVRQILIEDHQIDLATALGEQVPNVHAPKAS